MTHRRTIRQGDEVYCAACRLRWGKGDDEPPQCIPVTTQKPKPNRLSREQVAEEFRKLRENLSGVTDGQGTR